MNSLPGRIAGLALVILPAIGWSADALFGGTTWQLLAIQSMDDAQGTTRVDDPGRFTLAFGHDGRAAFHLDCNRGSGEYRVMPAGDVSTGSMTFGPIAMTRALCAPPPLDARVARDMPYVRGYLLKGGMLYLSLMADGGIYEWAPVHAAGSDQDPYRVVKPVEFARGSSDTLIRDHIAGPQYIDFQLRASAGQRMTANLEASHSANSVNLLPPETVAAAMAIGARHGNRIDRLLPDDGIYTLRVFLMRSAGREDTSAFSLSVSITGDPLAPLAVQVDAGLPGTRYHARTFTPCAPSYSQARECEALVVRRGLDGTATVELRWEGERRRRILFIKGEPQAADVPQALSFTRHARGWRVSFDDDEHFEIPEGLVYRG